MRVFAVNFANNAIKFRNSFSMPDHNVLHWFPGHMGKGLKQMEARLKTVDCVIEVHDARIPFSGRNPKFSQTVLGIKPHILILNKSDLIDEKYKKNILERLTQEEGLKHVLFTNCKDQKCPGLKSVMKLGVDLIAESDRFNRSHVGDCAMMVIGVPNVGKSSFINMLRSRHLRKGKAAAVGAVAGVTRSVQERIKISENPPVYLLDTPGIMNPRVDSIVTGLKLALCGTLKDHLVGEVIMADFLLFWLNKTQDFKYAQVFELQGPVDNVLEWLVPVAVARNLHQRVRMPDGSLRLQPNIVTAAQIVVRAFREGNLGTKLLDLDETAFLPKPKQQNPTEES